MKLLNIYQETVASYTALFYFNNEDIITFFENLGVKLKEEDHGRMFPVSNKAQSVVDALLTRLKDLGVKFVQIRLSKQLNMKMVKQKQLYCKQAKC